VLVPFAATAAMTSIALAASASTPSARISASDETVRYGKHVRLTGEVPGLSGAAVQIAFQRDGGRPWRTVESARTDPAGSYEARVKPDASGAYRAIPVGGAASVPVPVRVRSVRAKKHVVIRGRVKLKGRVLPASTGRDVRIKLPGSDERTRTRGGGRFKATWRPRSTGRSKLRAAARGDRIAAASHSRGRRVTVYRRASASWYGPGFYGNRTACGQTLGTSTLGVAHRSMKCGTRLTQRHGNRTVRVRVIDRGPFSGGREFDLTGATKNRLGFGSTGTVLTSR
jgi:hypothetical protein